MSCFLATGTVGSVAWEQLCFAWGLRKVADQRCEVGAHSVLQGSCCKTTQVVEHGVNFQHGHLAALSSNVYCSGLQESPAKVGGLLRNLACPPDPCLVKSFAVDQAGEGGASLALTILCFLAFQPSEVQTKPPSDMCIDQA